MERLTYTDGQETDCCLRIDGWPMIEEWRKGRSDVGKYFMDGLGCSLGGLGASLVGQDSEECSVLKF